MLSNDLNETFTISKGSASDISSIPTVCARKVPVTKASLKPLTGSSGMPKPTFTKPKGRPQPVKAVPQARIGNRNAAQTPKSLGSTPGRQKGSVTSEKQLSSSQTPSMVQRSKSFTTPKAHSTARTRSSISTGQPIKSAQTPSKAKKPELLVTPRKRGSATGTPRSSSTTVSTPVRRCSSAVEAGMTKKTGATQDQNKGKRVHRPATPENGICVSRDTVTPTNPGKDDQHSLIKI